MTSKSNASVWHASVLTLYPEMFPGPFAVSLAGRALDNDLWRLTAHNIRRSATDRHHTVDGPPAGGGPGMVLRADVLDVAIENACPAGDPRPLICLSPRGKRLTQSKIRALASGPGAVLLCGRFEGIDQRILDARDIEEVSVGDFVLAGGEIAAMALIDAVVRLLPGVMGKAQSSEDESFEHGLLEYPHYTAPRAWQGREIPEILLSGDHGRVAAWRASAAQELTKARRPDLWAAYQHSQSTTRDSGKQEPATRDSA
ncbi:MAG: tRNA (guanosine(37)-N1)-methyltransferase TrmD [Alphaproteobacteria bacterium]